jgi:hypothetical protein
MCLASFLGIRASYDVGAIVDCALSVERALLAGETLDKELGIGALIMIVSCGILSVLATAYNHEVLRSLGVGRAAGGIASSLGLPQRRRGTVSERLHRCDKAGNCRERKGTRRGELISSYKLRLASLWPLTSEELRLKHSPRQGSCRELWARSLTTRSHVPHSGVTRREL